VPTQNVSTLSEELRTLPRKQHLIESHGLSAYFARAEQIPRILTEIGRLREETFRLAGEGTGKPIDLDRFDNIYIHLFVWNNVKEELVGAYRLGPTDEILPRYGKKGLYTHTLFKYKDKLLAQMGVALEMGRTFIRKEYQKNYASLFLLWKGIGQYVVLNQRYKYLFGAVSISNDYQTYSRKIIAAFLQMNNFSSDLAKMVKPRKPFQPKDIRQLVKRKDRITWNDPDDLSSCISNMEEDGKGIPILLKQYLKLGGKFLSFHLDKTFGDVLDGLMIVDLTLTDPRLLKKYMGSGGYEDFMNFQLTLNAELKSDSRKVAVS
jgi:putative hemolysin